MRKSICLLIVLFAVASSLHAAPKNPHTFIFEDYGTVRTLDPSVAYDNVSQQRILNLYETLIFFDGSATDKFIPVLATQVPSVANGGISADGKTYRVSIRKGVKFHHGSTLTAEDVAYSFKRHMIADPDGGPMWMMLEALTGEGSTRGKDGNIVTGVFEKIDKSVAVKADQVVFNLPRPFPPFLTLLANSYGGIVVDKEWAVQNGCWDGNIANAAKYNNPKPGHEPLQNKASGTGAFKMLSWEPSKQFIFERFEDYWGPKPVLKKAIIKHVSEWSSRKLALQNGDADKVTVDAQFLPEAQAMQGVKIYKVPQLSVTGALFCQKVNPTGNPNIGSGKLDGDGIPPDFFSDIHVRRAFLHAFDRETYKADVWNGEVLLPPTPNPVGLAYFKEDVPVYAFDLEKAAAEMKKAWDGQVWKKGFKMAITHNTGNSQREAAAHMLAENIMSLNPKFRIEVQNVAWKDYLVKYRNYQYPIFIIGWGADYPDPDNFLFTFMGSTGVYGRYMAYQNEEVDRLCKDGRQLVEPARRKAVYHRLQDLWYQEALGAVIYQQIAFLTYRDWVQGFVPHPMFNDPFDLLKRLSKK